MIENEEIRRDERISSETENAVERTDSKPARYRDEFESVVWGRIWPPCVIGYSGFRSELASATLVRGLITR